ncbi:MAG: hypothetical protein JWL80_402 [Parcubacteria group bacterium]|nr:hypothetical protein [Parcubacteria group bacterium]
MEGSLSEAIKDSTKGVSSQGDNEVRLAHIDHHMRGQSRGDLLVPSASKKIESVRFFHRELAMRFIGLATEDQAYLIDVLLYTLDAHDVNEAFIEFAWSATNNKKLHVKRITGASTVLSILLV